MLLQEEEEVTLASTIQPVLLFEGKTPPTSFQRQPVTGIPPTPSYQGSTQKCASHAVGKAVQYGLDQNEYDADQDEIIQSLQDIYRDAKARNPDEFHGKEITVKEIDQATRALTGRGEKIKLEIKTYWRNAYDDPVFTNPINDECAIVLRWNLGKDNQGKDINHAIFAKSYDPKTRIFACINSWGNSDNPTPDVYDSKIYAFDAVAFKSV